MGRRAVPGQGWRGSADGAMGGQPGCVTESAGRTAILGKPERRVSTDSLFCLDVPLEKIQIPGQSLMACHSSPLPVSKPQAPGSRPPGRPRSPGPRLRRRPVQSHDEGPQPKPGACHFTGLPRGCLHHAAAGNASGALPQAPHAASIWGASHRRAAWAASRRETRSRRRGHPGRSGSGPRGGLPGAGAQPAPGGGDGSNCDGPSAQGRAPVRAHSPKSVRTVANGCCTSGVLLPGLPEFLLQGFQRGLRRVLRPPAHSQAVGQLLGVERHP